MILKEAAEILLFQPDNYKDIYDTLHELHDMYALHTGISAGNITDKDIWLPSGNAVSSIKAAHCLLELQRTAVFIRGIYKAILALQQSFPGERIHILYAGCGPYATLLTPFTTRFKAEEIAFHLLDINEDSLVAAKKLYDALGIEKYVEEWICTDATTYQLPEHQTIHLMISETMLNALRKEPQVAIMLNLIPQLPEKGLFIPQEINVSAQLLSSRKETARYLDPNVEPERLNLGTVYSIGLYNCHPHKPVIIEIPGKIEENKDLQLLTDITVFENEKLGIYNCSLNMPLKITRVEGLEGKRIVFNYIMGETPGFIWKWLDNV